MQRRALEIGVACALAVLAMCGRAGGQQAGAAAATGIDLVAMVRDVGFPAAAFVMLYLLVRTSIAENTRAIRDLRDTVAELKGCVARINSSDRRGS